ncbi:hypothetical protein [Actinophytocola sp.]|uniref:hypothetical protein n=1 Tax=Actinophytocola sp. TaxID=1872138 RepID=UPI002D5E83D8|nr:hypothetical protein [Actinophytocola sp.]HYQ70004.1 hypothetical protein [Actinophytocola sp.]
MADNEQHHEPPADLVMPGDGSTAPAPPPAPRQPTPITPDEVRQFQEFQRFQELMRQQAEQGFQPGTPPPPGHLHRWSPPPPKESLPKRLLKAAVGKVITGLVVLAILVLAGYFAIDYFFGEDHDQLPASQTGGGKATTNLIFETTPRNAVLKVYDDIAQGDAKSACSRFTDDGRAQFTKNMSQYGNTCAEIVTTIYRSIAANHMKSEYANPWIPGSAVPTKAGNSVSVSSCAMEVSGGPRLGLLTLSKIPHSESAGGGDAQWIVSGHESEPADCGGSTSTPPTS